MYNLFELHNPISTSTYVLWTNLSDFCGEHLPFTNIDGLILSSFISKEYFSFPDFFWLLSSIYANIQSYFPFLILINHVKNLTGST